MADNTTVELDYELRTAKAQEDLRKLNEALKGVTSNFEQHVSTTSAGIKKLTGQIASYLKDMEKVHGTNSFQFSQAQQRGDSLLAGFLSKTSQGGSTTGVSNQVNKAAGQALINDVVNTAAAVQARVADAIVKTMTQELRTAQNVIEARLKTAQFNTNQSLLNSTDKMIAAREMAAAKRRDDALYALENGRAALNSKNRQEALNFNGGADLMAIQGRVMMNYMAVGAVFNAAKSLTNEIVELDREMHQFQAISTATNTEMATFKKNLLDISATVPFTTLEMTKAATMLAQAGLNTTDVIASLEAVTKFATATGSDLSQAVDVVTSTLTAFNLEASRTGDVANTFTAALNLSKLSVDKLVTAFNYIGPTANSLGLTLEETTAILGALSQSGVRASTMGTGFRALLTDLQSPSKKLTQTLQAAGLSIDDINVKTKGFLPVIETLKNAGFGAAEAYEALEVRAAASYVALANNTELAYDMNRAFTLSQAAVKANEIQMGSLSNTAKNFGGVVSAMAYSGFEPLLNVLQDILAASTNVLSWLNQYPAVLTTISTLVAGIAAMTTLALGGALVRSFATMVPLLATYSAATAGAAAGTGLLSTSLVGLSAVITKHPIGLLITAVVAAGAAFYSWQNSADDAAESLDKLQARVNELKGAADAAGQKISSIETAIQGLIDRRAELDDNELMRGAKIDELRQQFHELGLSIKDDTTSVTDLIIQLHNLKQTSSRLRRDQLSEAAATKRLEIDQQETALNSLVGGNQSGPWQLRDALNARFNNLPANPFGAVPRMFSGDDKLTNWNTDGVMQQFGPIIAEAVRVAFGDFSTVQNDPLRADGLASNVRQAIAELTLRMNGETGEQKDLTARDIAFLEQLKTSLEPVVAKITDIGAGRADLAVLDRTRASAAISASQSFKVAEVQQNWVQQAYDKRLSDINGQNLPAEQRIEAMDAVNDWLREASQKVVDQFKKDFENEQGSDPRLAGLNTSTIEGELKVAIDKLGVGVRAKILKDSAALAKTLEKELKKESGKQNAELRDWQRQIGEAKNTDVFEAAKKGYDDLFKSTRDHIVSYYDKLIELNETQGNTDEVERLEEDRERYLDQIATDFAAQARTNEAKQQDLLKDSLQREKDAREDYAKSIRDEIDLAMQELSRTPPSSAMLALVKKIQELNAKLAGELGKIGGIDTQLTGLSLGKPINPGTVASAQGIIQALQAAGLSKSGAAAVAGNLSLESGFDPTAKGDRDPGTGIPTAFGLAQWRGTRWDELQASSSNPWNTSEQLNFLMKELERDHPDLFARLKGGEDPATLAKAFMEQFEKPNSNPAVNHVTERMDQATAFAAGTSDAANAELTEKQKELQVKIDANMAAQVKASSDATIKNLNAKLASLSLQTRVSDNPGSIAEIQKEIEQAHKEIMEAELKKFDATKADLAKTNPTEFDAERKELQEKLRAAANDDALKALEEYYKNAEANLDRPITKAKAELDAAQQPANASKYTQIEIQKMQQNIADQERLANLQRVQLMEQQIADVRSRAAAAEKTYGVGSDEALIWRRRENDLLETNATLKTQVNALDAAAAKQAPTVAQGIQQGTQAWAQQNGILDAAGNMVPLATQVGAAWTETLTGLSTGLSTFFTNATNGTMSLGDAFKQLGTDLLGMFSQIIAKALANQIIMSLFGGASGGSWMESLFGIVGGGGVAGAGAVGSATGGAVRKATGGGSPFRDSKLYNLMDGEYVLRQSAVKAIGVDKLDQMNNLGNRQISEGALARPQADEAQQGGGTVNVWVVSPDQMPPPGPRDIIATVASDIQRRGTIKQLIQQVQMGNI